MVGRVFWTGALAAARADVPVRNVRETLGRLRVKELVLPNEPAELLRRARVHVPPRADPRRRVRVVAEGAPRHASTRRLRGGRKSARATAPSEIAELIATHDLEALRYLEELGDTSPARADAERVRVPMEPGGRRPRRGAAGSRPRRCGGTGTPSIWPSRSASPVAERAAIAQALARASLRDARRPRRPSGPVRRALGIGEEAGDDLGAGWAESQLVMIRFQQGADEDALAFGDRAIARLEPLGDTSELAEAFRHLGQFHWRRGRLRRGRCRSASRRAMARSRRRADGRSVLAAAMQDLGVELVADRASEEALATMEEAFAWRKEVGDPVNLQRLYNNFSSTLADCGSDFLRARAIGLEGLEMARRGGGLGWIGVGRRHARGDLARARGPRRRRGDDT